MASGCASAASQALCAGSTKLRSPASAASTMASAPRMGRSSPESEFAGEFVTVEPVCRDLAGGGEDAERDRQVEAAGFLRQVGRGEVDGDAAGREFETGIDDRGARGRAPP